MQILTDVKSIDPF